MSINSKISFFLGLILTGGMFNCSSAPSGALNESSEGKVFSYKQVVFPKSDERGWLWQIVYASTEDTWNEDNLFIAVHRRGEVYTAGIYHKVGDDYKLLKRLTTEGNSCFLKPNVLWVTPQGEDPNQKREQLIQITELFYGTGCFKQEHIFTTIPNSGHSAPDLKLADVEFIPASESFEKNLAKGEGVWKGVDSILTEAKFTFHFCIWKEGDANCCPSAGEVTGTYKLERKSGNKLQISMDKFKREPIADSH